MAFEIPGILSQGASGDFFLFVWKLFLAIIVAVPIGIEREKAKKFAGLRTSLLIAAFGFFSSFLGKLFESTLVVFLGLLFAISVALLIYFNRSKREKHPGLTTSTVFVLLFCLGAMVELGLVLESIASSILITFLLVLKPFASFFIKHLSEREIIEGLFFAFLSFIVLPAIPNKAIDPWGFFNPFVVWSMTLLVIGMGFAAYISAKVFGERAAAWVSGVSGGLVSLVATNVAISGKAKGSKEQVSKGTSIALSIALLVTIVRVLVLSFVGNRSLGYFLAIPLVIALGAIVASGKDSIFLSKRKNFSLDLRHSTHLSFSTAAKFAVIFTAVLFLFKMSHLFLGPFGVYGVSAIAGFASLNALVVSIASFVSSGGVTAKEATISILIGLFSSSLANLVLAYNIGGKKHASLLLKPFGIAAAVFLAFAAGFYFFW